MFKDISKHSLVFVVIRKHNQLGVTYLGQAPLRPISFSTQASPTKARPIHNIVLVCLVASPAEGRRRLHANMTHARLLIFNRPSVEGRKAFRVFRVFRCLGVQVFRCSGV